jgi:hypothetical protein
LFVPGVAAEKSNENIQLCYIFIKKNYLGLKSSIGIKNGLKFFKPFFYSYY